jgi:flagellar basal body-associated protein FliL
MNTKPPVKAKTTVRKKRKSSKIKIRTSTVVLILVFLLVVVLALMVYSDPTILDPISQAMFGQRPTVSPDQTEVARWTQMITFSSTIDETIRARTMPIPPTEIPPSELGKANPFVAVSP